MIICSDGDLTTKIVHLDNNLNVISSDLMLQATNFQIDPTIRKIKDTYYVTLTDIKGNVNNGDASQENGIYTVNLYTSTDLKNWENISQVISDNHNIEDVIMYYDDQTESMKFIYEREQLDKGKSSINMLSSYDNGKTWVEPIVLVPENADNEPAYFYKTDNGFDLFYSSDFENPGTSYEGAKVYINRYDNSMKLIEERVSPNLNNSTGNLLYDVRVEKDGIYYLFTQKYITESNLILEMSNTVKE